MVCSVFAWFVVFSHGCFAWFFSGFSWLFCFFFFFFFFHFFLRIGFLLLFPECEGFRFNSGGLEGGTSSFSRRVCHRGLCRRGEIYAMSIQYSIEGSWVL